MDVSTITLSALELPISILFYFAKFKAKVVMAQQEATLWH